MEDLLQALSQNPVFAQLDEAQRADVLKSGLSRSYDAGGVIVFAEDIWPYILVVMKGRVDGVMESREGRRLIMVSFKPGDVFWGLAFFHDNARMPVTLEAYEPSHLYVWSRDRLLPILLQNGKALWELSRLMVSRMQQASMIVEGLAFQSVAGRLARLMLDQFAGADTPTVTRNLKLDEIAALVGSTREMVCRALYDLSNKNLIQITRTEFVLTDQEGLEEIARQ